MDATFYRLAETSRTLPTHWCYTDPCERHELVTPTGPDTCEVENVWIDNRVPGFQAWQSAASVACVLLGEDRDGEYDSQSYPYLISVDVDPVTVGDGCGEWVAIETFIRAQQCSTNDLTTWLRDRGGDCLREAIADNDWGLVETWAEDNEATIADWIQINSKPIEPVYEETIAGPPTDEE